MQPLHVSVAAAASVVVVVALVRTMRRAAAGVAAPAARRSTSSQQATAPIARPLGRGWRESRAPPIACVYKPLYRSSLGTVGAWARG